MPKLRKQTMAWTFTFLIYHGLPAIFLSICDRTITNRLVKVRFSLVVILQNRRFLKKEICFKEEDTSF